MIRTWLTLILNLCISSMSRQPDSLPDLQYANHVFNAIHNSMRQFGSSYYHNGMSLFAATIPKGVQLYHGTSVSHSVNGTKWLAFEPEFALVFAGPPKRPPSVCKDGGLDTKAPKKQTGSRDLERCSQKDKISADISCVESPSSSPGTPIGIRHSDVAELDGPPHHAYDQTIDSRPNVNSQTGHETRGHGYLHTYRARRDLRLLYLDGQSGAETLRGCLDMQDIVLLHGRSMPSHLWRDDHLRAAELCKMVREDWDDRIDGFLRMEMGFEVILCSPERDLDLEQISQAQAVSSEDTIVTGDQLTSWYRAIATRFDGIGGGRVRLNYHRFVSLFSLPDSIYFDPQGFPRIHNESRMIGAVHKAIRDMVLSNDKDPGIDWQAAVDMVVARYAPRLQYLASGEITDLGSLKMEVEDLFRSFVDHRVRDQPAEIQRCATQFVPFGVEGGSLAATTFSNVTRSICSTLSAARDAESLDLAVKAFRDLKSWLAWTTWKQCQGCTYRELCLVPIYMIGSEDDRNQPRCVKDLNNVSFAYWEE